MPLDKEERGFMIEGLYNLVCGVVDLQGAYEIYPQLEYMKEKDLLAAVAKLRKQLVDITAALVDEHLFCSDANR